MENAAVTNVFGHIADLLELEKGSYFKIRAYRRVARTIDELPVGLEQVLKEGKLREIPGVGEAIGKKIAELLTTGRVEFYERLLSDASEGIGRGEDGQPRATGWGA